MLSGTPASEGGKLHNLNALCPGNVRLVSRLSRYFFLQEILRVHNWNSSETLRPGDSETDHAGIFLL
jgi:hypothetical protein